MDTTVMIAIGIIVAVVLVALIVFMWARNHAHTSRLRAEFGSEYDRTVNRSDSRRDAEAELEARHERVLGYQLRELEPEEQRRYTERWRAIQSEFIDQPGLSIMHADSLLDEVLVARGYPAADGLDRSAEISVGHGDEAQFYRSARRVAMRNRDGQASTEELRQGLTLYRRVFDSMMNPTPHEAQAAH